MVRVFDFDSVGTVFESHSEHSMDLFHSSPEISNPSAALVNRLVADPGGRVRGIRIP